MKKYDHIINLYDTKNTKNFYIILDPKKVIRKIQKVYLEN